MVKTFGLALALCAGSAHAINTIGQCGDYNGGCFGGGGGGNGGGGGGGGSGFWGNWNSQGNTAVNPNKSHPKDFGEILTNVVSVQDTVMPSMLPYATMMITTVPSLDPTIDGMENPTIVEMPELEFPGAHDGCDMKFYEDSNTNRVHHYVPFYAQLTINPDSDPNEGYAWIDVDAYTGWPFMGQWDPNLFGFPDFLPERLASPYWPHYEVQRFMDCIVEWHHGLPDVDGPVYSCEAYVNTPPGSAGRKVNFWINWRVGNTEIQAYKCATIYEQE